MKLTNIQKTAFIWATILLIFALGSGMKPGHALYLSVCHVDHNPESQSLEISAKLFTEDLEAALDAQGLSQLHLGAADEVASADSFVAGYLQKQIQLSVNGKALPFEYLGKEVKMDVTWCYLEVQGVQELEELTITNRLFMELFEPQTNLVHVRARGQEKSLMLKKDKPSATLVF